MKKTVIGVMADHATPKASRGVGICFTMSRKDYKGAMIVVLSEDNRESDGEQPSGELLRTGCVQRHVRDGECIWNIQCKR